MIRATIATHAIGGVTRATASSETKSTDATTGAVDSSHKEVEEEGERRRSVRRGMGTTEMRCGRCSTRWTATVSLEAASCCR